MTRFARAKGSKASNERVEEEATPWEEMKAAIPAPKLKKAIDVEALEDDLELDEPEPVKSENEADDKGNDV